MPSETALAATDPIAELAEKRKLDAPQAGTTAPKADSTTIVPSSLSHPSSEVFSAAKTVKAVTLPLCLVFSRSVDAGDVKVVTLKVPRHSRGAPCRERLTQVKVMTLNVPALHVALPAKSAWRKSSS